MYKVLHIEDDENNRVLVRKVLTASGFQVVEAGDGVSGIKKALESQPDIILLDIVLPDMDGYEVTLKLRGELSSGDIPIVALSGQGDKDMSKAVGCDAHIKKPIDISKFPDQVLTFIKAKRKRVSRPPEDDGTLLRAQGQKIASKLLGKIEELEKTNRQLLESEKVRTEFYRNLSHELSTPLTPSVGYLNMLMSEELGPLTPLQRKAITSIERSVKRVRGVVENLLDMTALSTGKMTFFARNYDFNLQAEESVGLCMARFEEKGITLQTEIARQNMRGFGDPDKLKRAMVQLLENAVKFCSGDGHVVVGTEVGEDGRFQFYVLDSGKGIPEEEQQAIFRSFYQIDGSPTREHGGTGLGLALARKIVERFGGEIWAESPPVSQLHRHRWAKTLVGLWIPKKMKEDGEGNYFTGE